MTAYADYTYYSATYLGTAITSLEFPRLALRASAVIDQITFGRAVTDTDNATAIKNATCAIAEEMQAIENSDGSEYIASESQGRYSVTYAQAATEYRLDTERYQDAARVYLGSTGLMFPGFVFGEYYGQSA